MTITAETSSGASASCQYTLTLVDPCTSAHLETTGALFSDTNFGIGQSSNIFGDASLISRNITSTHDCGYAQVHLEYSKDGGTAV